MPMTLNIGLSRKVGEPNFGSRGAAVNFAVEVEASLLREPDQLREKIKYLFAQAKLAVEEELNSGQREAGENNEVAGNGHVRNSNGDNNSNRNGSSNGRHRPGGNGRGATVSQVRAIHAIASRQRIDLSSRLDADFGVAHPEDLSIGQASELIDAMKANGAGVRR